MKGFLAKTWKRIKRFAFFAFLLHLAYAIALIWFTPPITLTMISNMFKGYGLNYERPAYHEQGKQIKLAALASEDQKFPDHYGIDFTAVKDVLVEKSSGKRLRGGSTITQQTAKNVFLWQGRSWVRKGLEAYSSLLIELIWSKKRILEYYLHIAEMGEGIYGIKAAAKHYYNTTPSKLSAVQAASIISCLPNPKKRNPLKPTNKMKRKQQWILSQMKILAQDKDVKAILSN